MHVALKVGDTPIEFDLGYDETFRADVNTRTVLQQNGGESEVMHLMVRVLQPGDIAIDGGANIGFFSILMAQLVGSAGRVLAFEPGSNNLAKLRENLALNRLDNVEVIDKALWHRNTDVLEFYLCEDSGENAAWKSEFALSEVIVGAVQLSGYIRNREQRPKLIKLDVEGSEQHALEGAYMLLGWQVPYIVCELNEPALARLSHTQKTLRKLMMNFGYDMFVLHADGRLPSLVPVGSTVECGAPNTNMLFSTAKFVSQAWPIVHV